MILAGTTIPILPEGAFASASRPDLGSLILANPEPGWQRAPQSEVQAITDRLETVDSNAVSGERVLVAARIWQSPTHLQLLTITLSRWPSNVGNLDQVLRTGLNDECVAFSGSNPRSIGSAPEIAGSLEATCPASTAGARLSLVAARRGDLMEFIESISERGAAALEIKSVSRIARNQLAVLPAPPVDRTPIAIGVVALVLLTVIAALVVRSARRSSRPQPTAARLSTPMASVAPARPPPLVRLVGTEVPFDHRLADPEKRPIGWHPDAGDPNVMRYWDGKAWTAKTLWDGSSWVAAD
jgi:hypothetical protein